MAWNIGREFAINTLNIILFISSLRFLGKPFWDEVNPVQKKIPVLIHNGKSVCESLIIVEYIDEVWKDRCPLLLADPYQRAKAKFWADFIDKMVYPPSDKVWAANGEEEEGGKKAFIDGIKLLEGELKSNPYFGGETLGFLDIAFLPLYYWFHTFETFGKFSIEAECPKLVAWGERSSCTPLYHTHIRSMTWR
ncbi:Glutathione S-transferase U25 [Vitis vinifera]|uniref:Glutathione S-transferase n=1 Tax=Vitis vinifera TaxID=29760 RepID=A0A438GA59_VITVI|nr:Glutathione S-transferase U25 [Vitis vinifera]